MAILVGTVIGFVVAMLTERVRHWWKHRPIWKALESHTKRDGFRLHERPSNVSALTHKPVHKSAPKKTAA